MKRQNNMNYLDFTDVEREYNLSNLRLIRNHYREIQKHLLAILTINKNDGNIHLSDQFIDEQTELQYLKKTGKAISHLLESTCYNEFDKAIYNAGLDHQEMEMTNEELDQIMKIDD